MNYTYTFLVAEAITVGSALTCAVRLHGLQAVKENWRVPLAAILIIGITSLITGLQFVFPEILTALRRNPDALRAGEWWRMVTPLFVQSNGWMQCGYNGVTALIFLPLAEKFYGKGLFALYFIAGIAGEVFQYAWHLNGAGSSLGIYGVMGSLFALVCRHRNEVPKPTIIFAICGLCGAVVLSFIHDGHGPSLLAGAMVAIKAKSKLQPASKASDKAVLFPISRF